MKELKTKILGGMTFTVVLVLHIYFALLLGTRSAWAQDSATPVPETSKVEKVEKVEKAKPVKAAKAAPQAGATDLPPPPPPPPPKPPKAPRISDTEINIKIDPKEGLTVKGIDKMVEKLEAIDRHNRDEDDDGDQEVNIDENGIKIKKRVHIRDDEDGEENEEHRSVVINRDRTHALVGIIVPSVMFLGFFAAVGLFLFFRYKARRDSLETIKMFIEKGQPIPPEIMATLKGRDSNGNSEWEGYQSHLLKGLKPIFWGLGIVLFFVFEHFDAVPWFFGVVFILIGAHHVVKSHLIQKEKEKNPQPVVDPAVVKVEEPKN